MSEPGRLSACYSDSALSCGGELTRLPTPLVLAASSVSSCAASSCVACCAPPVPELPPLPPVVVVVSSAVVLSEPEVSWVVGGVVVVSAEFDTLEPKVESEVDTDPEPSETMLPLLLGMMMESESSQLPGQQPDELPESSGQEPGQQPEELSLEEEELSLEDDELSLDEDELSLDEEEPEELLPPPEELEERAFRKSASGSASRSLRRATGASMGRAAECTRGAEKRVAAEMMVKGPRFEMESAEDMMVG